MASFNRVQLLGNLTRDPELRYTPSNTPVVSFGIACNREWKDAQGEKREEATFVDCSAFAKTAELINQYYRKGSPIFVEGRLKLDTWDDKQGGGKRTKLSVVVEQLIFLPKSGDSDRQDSPPRPQRMSRPAPAQDQGGGGNGGEQGMDDMPF